MFSGNVICVYCRCQINFSANNISYQNQRCASHNQEHQFPGMNIIVNESNNNQMSNFKNLPVSSKPNSIPTPFKHPNPARTRTNNNPKTTNLQYNERNSITSCDNTRNNIQNIPVPPFINSNLGNFLIYNVPSNMYSGQ